MRSAERSGGIKIASVESPASNTGDQVSEIYANQACSNLQLSDAFITTNPSLTPAQNDPNLSKRNSSAGVARSIDPILATTALVTVANCAKVGFFALGAVAVQSGTGIDLGTFVEGIALMGVSIAADAMANVVSQNHKLNKKGIMAYAAAIGASHAIYPLVGFGLALAIEYGVKGGAYLAGQTVMDPEVAKRIAQGLVATTVYGFGSLFLFRFLKNGMIPDFAGKEKVEDEAKTQEKTGVLTKVAKRFGDAYEDTMERIENKLLDTSQGGIESFNNMPITIKNLTKSLRHPDVVRCSMDSFVSTFAKVAFIASLGFVAQCASIGLTSLCVFGLVLGAGAISHYGFSLLKKATQRLAAAKNLETDKPTKPSVLDRLSLAIKDKAAALNHYVTGGFKVIALATLGGFASNAAAEAVINLAQAGGMNAPAKASLILTAAFFSIYSLYTVGARNLKDIWRHSKNEAEEVVNSIKKTA